MAFCSIDRFSLYQGTFSEPFLESWWSKPFLEPAALRLRKSVWSYYGEPIAQTSERYDRAMLVWSIFQDWEYWRMGQESFTREKDRHEYYYQVPLRWIRGRAANSVIGWPCSHWQVANYVHVLQNDLLYIWFWGCRRLAPIDPAHQSIRICQGGRYGGRFHRYYKKLGNADRIIFLGEISCDGSRHNGAIWNVVDFELKRGQNDGQYLDHDYRSRWSTLAYRLAGM